MLTFYIIFLLSYPAAEKRTTIRSWLMGLAFSIPLLFLARLSGSLIPPMYGTVLAPFHEAADRFVPYALLPAAAHVIFHHRDTRVEKGRARREFTAFFAGALSISGFAEIFHTVESPSTFVLFALPFLTVSVMLAAPRFWSGLLLTEKGASPRRPFALLKKIKGNKHIERAAGLLGSIVLTERIRIWLFFAAACLAASLVPGFFRHRQWFLAWPLTLGISLFAWAVALPGLRENANS